MPAQLGDHVHRKAARLQRSARTAYTSCERNAVELHARGDKTVDGGGMDLGRGAVRLDAVVADVGPPHVVYNDEQHVRVRRRGERHRWQELPSTDPFHRGVREEAHYAKKGRRQSTLMHG